MNCGNDDGPHVVCSDCLTHMGPDGVVLDDADPFESTLASMIEVYRRKRADYAQDSSQWSNFEDMARFAGFSETWMPALVLCQQKLSRISALRGNGRAPSNESVVDSLLDNANYAVIALAIAMEK